MADHIFKIGDRVKVNPAEAASYVQPWRKLIESGRAATVRWVYKPGDWRAPLMGNVTIDFDGKFRYPKRRQVDVRKLTLIEPAPEVKND